MWPAVALVLLWAGYAHAQVPPQSYESPPTTAEEPLDPRFEQVVRQLIASPSGRAFLEALMLIEREYLYSTDTEALLRGATAGLVAALDDPYSRYVDAATVAARRDGEPSTPFVDKVLLGDVGYVRVSSFEDDTVGFLTGRAIDAHLATGARALVLDLRGNAGGPVLQGLQVLDRFLSDGVLGFRRVRGVSVPIAYANPRAVNQPLVVLVDAATASTAEIVAGALQAYGRAELVGGTTAGKGIGQTAIELSDGAELQLVSFEWLLPGFRTIDGSGLRPDVEVSDALPADALAERRVAGLQDVADDPALAAALRFLRDVIGDDLATPATKPAPPPSVGPAVVTVPDGVGDGDAPSPEPPAATPDEAPADPTAVPADGPTEPATVPPDAPPSVPPATPPIEPRDESPVEVRPATLPGDGEVPGEAQAEPPEDGDDDAQPADEPR